MIKRSSKPKRFPYSGTKKSRSPEYLELQLDSSKLRDTILPQGLGRLMRYQ